jgi:hypothetical protein
MELGVFRKYFNENYTIGKFFIDSRYLCDTLEDKVRDLQDKNHDGDFNDPGEGKVYGQTAIPCGRYSVSIVWWNKHQKFVAGINGVPGFTSILIHAVATAKDTEGCIGVGENKAKGRLVNGPYYSGLITDMVSKAIDAGERVFITIKE